MTWFEELTGFVETSPATVRQQLVVEGRRLHSRTNAKSWQFGELEIPSLGDLRQRIQGVRPTAANLVREVVANVQHLHIDPQNSQALFQVASQFNLLEMTSPGVTPESGVGDYELDFTQGPACAIAAGAGTIYRNYFVNVAGHIGQSVDRQIDCLQGVGKLLDNSHNRLWQMVNGYALPTEHGLPEINEQLRHRNEFETDQLRQALQIGLQWDTEVTLDAAGHTVSQAYCSAMPVAYTRQPREQWAPVAKLVLEAAYEATACAAILNRQRTGCSRLFLTLLGGGAFGNNPEWITAAVRRALQLYADYGLDIAIVSYGSSNRSVRELVKEF